MTKGEAIIKKTLDMIEEQIGLKLELCPYFTGYKKKHFNVLVNTNIFSPEFNQLERFANQYKTIRIERSGHNRAAVYPI